MDACAPGAPPAKVVGGHPLQPVDKTPFKTHAQILTEEPKRPNWLIENFITHPSRTLIFAEQESFKSWLLLDLAQHLASGTPWQGFHIPRPYRVLYVDEEMDELSLTNRIRGLALGADIAASENFVVLSGHGFKAIPGAAPKLLTLLKERLSGWTPEVVMFETVARIIYGDENTAADAVRMWGALQPFFRRGISTLVSHHMRKKGNDEEGGDFRYRARGSSALISEPDYAYAMTASRENARVTITNAKARHSPPPSPFTLQFTSGGPTGPFRFHPVARVPGRPPEASDEAKTWLEEHPDATYKEAADAGIKKDTYYRSKRS